ncbi:TetR family transcriptional regulator [Mycolicibacter heraklionensis]|uniref:TetR family transcriptional regulator n=1 Tax=Mycolicibacter heraklionensis TaxID=512402 RepID=A0A9X7WFU7_9MYCO|nr:TetR/AcrR family transcriptional regulator [Mycolicibacter heraklionensis]KLO29289.1 TetR family transcriptional regulator [Mycolicibacter heraklionensis]QZA06599.1 TetR/AcrR family transcriptional regulator [Mycolicibacter heraklionensis]
MADTARTTRRRPKDRKDQIARAAAESFSTLGYHAVSVENIATEVGVSAPALYRHYASKYDLFRVAVLALSQQLVDVTDIVVDPAAGPAAALDQLIHALIDVALRNRESGGLYRWQARYLREPDATTLLDQLRLVNQRLQQPLAELRPAAPLLHRQMLSAALLSVAGGITDHHLRATADDITDLLTTASRALLHTEFPVPDNFSSGASGARIFTADAGMYEAVLHASMMLFHRHGYAETSVAQIAKAAGLRISSIYGYFPGKADILSTALRRSSDRLSAELSVVNTNRSEPREALTQLVDIYVATSFANPELASIYYSEQIHLSPSDRALLRNVQRSTIDSWVGLLRSVRPELTATAARFLVHAAMGLVVDLGRLVHYDRPDPSTPHRAYEQACVRTLMHSVLFGA